MIKPIIMRLGKKAVSVFAFTFLASIFAATARAGEIPPAAEEMAKTFGLDSWGQIEGIRYTWNAEVPGAVKPFDGGSGTIKISHTWEWDPKTGTISYEGKDMNGQPLKAPLWLPKAVLLETRQAPTPAKALPPLCTTA